MATCSPFWVVSSVVVLLLLVHVASAIGHVQYKADDLSSEKKRHELFEHWRHRHGKTYTSPAEKQARFEIFKQNLDYIHHRNLQQGSHSYKLGLTLFADLTLEEFRSSYLAELGTLPSATPPSKPHLRHPSACRSVPPPSVDWRQHGAVTPIKDQGQCGSCWAFSSVGAIEGAYAIATGNLISLSEQELVSCVVANAGCQGGWMDTTFEWIIKNGGINSERGYPYVSGIDKNYTCNLLKIRRKVVSLDSYVDVKPYDEYALRCAVSQQPVSVAINGGALDFQFYTGGIFNGFCPNDPKDLDHAVVVVGYGSKNGKDYWIIKNSWSKDWGLEGYMLMERSSGKSNGLCGIQITPSYPIAKVHA